MRNNFYNESKYIFFDILYQIDEKCDNISYNTAREKSRNPAAEISDDKSQKFQRREPNKPQIDVTKRKK